jgi:preprotein translocase subunit SecA
MYTRAWLQTELAKDLPWDKHHWENSNPIPPFARQSCVGHMTTAKELFDKSKSAADLELWTLAVNRAEKYVTEKHKHRPYGKFSIQDKTSEHNQIITEHREMLLAGNWHVKDAEFKILEATIENRKTEYMKTLKKPELKQWKAALDQAKQFLKKNDRDKDLLKSDLNEYTLAEKEYNKQNSCISRCFFWCYEEVEVFEIAWAVII